MKRLVKNTKASLTYKEKANDQNRRLNKSYSASAGILN
jgi:hypothetical protein